MFSMTYTDDECLIEMYEEETTETAKTNDTVEDTDSQTETPERILLDFKQTIQSDLEFFRILQAVEEEANTITSLIIICFPLTMAFLGMSCCSFFML